MYFVSDQEGVFQLAVDMEFTRLQQEGLLITPLMRSRIIDRIKRDQTIYHSKVKQKGVPKTLEMLFNIDKKSDIEKYCRSISINEINLFLLIHNAEQIDFKHQANFPEYIPSHLNITKNDTDELKKGNVRPYTKKITPLMTERRRIHVHLFEHGTKWHCFYFSYDDIHSAEKNHWKYGCHLHYISYLWPNFTKPNIWKAFDKRATEIGGNIHIRFSPFEYSEFNHLPEVNISDKIKQAPWIIDYESDFDINPNSTPSPTLQTTTRGFWTATISANPDFNN